MTEIRNLFHKGGKYFLFLFMLLTSRFYGTHDTLLATVCC